VIHGIRKLAREIHQRSVWQVLGAFLVVGWISLELIVWATDRLGLPGWTPTMALVLMALVLPVVVATAVVQGGLPEWLQIEDIDPNELEGLTPEQVHVIPEAHPLHAVRLFTWRKAVLVGVMSLALLVTSVVAYLTMWALGIGPVGSLLAQGLIDDGEPVLLATFENRTDVPGLGEAMRDAFEADLAESQLVTVVDGERVARALREMNRNVSSRLSLALAQDVAVSEGIRVVVHGEVAGSGRDGYRLTIGVFLSPGSSSVSQFRETVDDADELVPAIDVLAERTRARLGESLRVIRSERPLVDQYGPELIPER
jgi:hypothetical protein